MQDPLPVLSRVAELGQHLTREEESVSCPPPAWHSCWCLVLGVAMSPSGSAVPTGILKDDNQLPSIHTELLAGGAVSGHIQVNFVFVTQF